jgi:hypothetical protein
LATVGTDACPGCELAPALEFATVGTDACPGCELAPALEFATVGTDACPGCELAPALELATVGLEAPGAELAPALELAGVGALSPGADEAAGLLGELVPSSGPLFLPGEKAMTSEAALFLLIAADISAGGRLGIVGAAGCGRWYAVLTMTVSGDGAA